MQCWDFTGGTRLQKRVRRETSGLWGLPAPLNVGNVLAALSEISIAVAGRWVIRRRSERAQRPVHHGEPVPSRDILSANWMSSLSARLVWAQRLGSELQDGTGQKDTGLTLNFLRFSAANVVVGTRHTIYTHLHLCDREIWCPAHISCLLWSSRSPFTIPRMREKEFSVCLAQTHKTPDRAACCWGSPSVCPKLCTKWNKSKWEIHDFLFT